MIRRALIAPVLTLAVLMGAASCTPAPEPATDLTALVELAAEQAAAGDLAAASDTIDALERRVVAQRDAGEVDGPAAAEILATVALVRADIVALTPAPEPTPEPEATVEIDESGTGNENGEVDDNGKGKNDDNGKGKGNDDGGKD